jgi:hypothetical protein
MVVWILQILQKNILNLKNNDLVRVIVFELSPLYKKKNKKIKKNCTARHLL